MSRVSVNPVRVKVAPATTKKSTAPPAESQSSLLNAQSERFITALPPFGNNIDLSNNIPSRTLETIRIGMQNERNPTEKIEHEHCNDQTFEEQDKKAAQTLRDSNNNQGMIRVEDDKSENVAFKNKDFHEDGRLSPHEEIQLIPAHGGNETVIQQTHPNNTSATILINQPVGSNQELRNSPRASPSNAMASTSSPMNNNAASRTQPGSTRTAQQNANSRMNELTHRIEISVYRKVVENIRTHIVLAVTVLIFYLLSVLVFKKVFPYHVPFAVLWFLCLVRSIQALRTKPKPRMTQKQKRLKYFEAAEWSILALFLVISTLKLEDIKVYLLPFATLGLLATLLFPLYYDLYRPVYKKRIVAGAKTVFWGQMLLIAFKADEVLTAWTYVFYLILITTFFCVAVSIGYLMVSLCYFVKNYGSPDFRPFMVGHVWELFYSVFSWPAAFSSFGLIQSLTDDPASILMVTLLVGLGHAFFFIVYTVFARKSIERFLMAPLLADARSKLDAVRNNQQFDSKEESAAYLVKISPTYYVEMPNGFKLKDKQKIDELKAQIRGKKMYGSTKSPRGDSKEPREPITREIHSAEKVNRDKGIERERGSDLKRRPKEIMVSQELIRPIALANTATKSDDKVAYSLNDVDKTERGLEHKEEDGDKQCIICFSETPNAVIMACGHSGVCYACAIEAWKKDDTCLLCRNPIEKVLKVNMYSGVDIAKVVISTQKQPLVL